MRHGMSVQAHKSTNVYDGQRRITSLKSKYTPRYPESLTVDNLKNEEYSYHNTYLYLVAIAGNAIEYALLAVIIAIVTIPTFDIIGRKFHDLFAKIALGL